MTEDLWLIFDTDLWAIRVYNSTYGYIINKPSGKIFSTNRGKLPSILELSTMTNNRMNAVCRNLTQG